jgi:hypothetical protein
VPGPPAAGRRTRAPATRPELRLDEHWLAPPGSLVGHSTKPKSASNRREASRRFLRLFRAPPIRPRPDGSKTDCKDRRGDTRSGREDFALVTWGEATPFSGPDPNLNRAANASTAAPRALSGRTSEPVLPTFSGSFGEACLHAEVSRRRKSLRRKDDLSGPGKNSPGWDCPPSYPRRVYPNRNLYSPLPEKQRDFLKKKRRPVRV